MFFKTTVLTIQISKQNFWVYYNEVKTTLVCLFYDELYQMMLNNSLTCFFQFQIMFLSKETKVKLGYNNYGYKEIATITNTLLLYGPK